MRSSGFSACGWIALACAGIALSVTTLNLWLWQNNPSILRDFAEGTPVMVPNSTIAIAFCSLGILILHLVKKPAWQRWVPVVLGAAMLALGVSYLYEAFSGYPLWINHAYFEYLARRFAMPELRLYSPSPHAGLVFVLLSVTFLLWRRNYWVSQLALFLNLGLSTIALLGHFYDMQSLYLLPPGSPASGMSVLAASSVVLLCASILCSRPRDSIVGLALSGSPAGTVVARFGVGALVALALFGLSAGLRYYLLDSSDLPALKATVTIVLTVGLVTLVWSTVRALDRIERERLRALEQVGQSREELLFAQRLAKVAYWQWNLLNDEICTSDEFNRLYGLPEAQRKFSFAELLRHIHPDDRRRVTEAAYNSIAGRSFFSVDFRAQRYDSGEIVHIHSQARVELDERGLPWRMRGASMDVTELKRAEVGARQAEERVRILLEKANEAVRVREDVLSIVSHDLKNPLTSANLGVQLLLRQIGTGPEKAPLARTAANIQRSIENMKSLIQSILDVGKIQSGTFAIDPKPVDPAELLQAIQEVMQPIAREKNIELRVSPAPSHRMLGDRARLQQVLSNLVGNALKFTPAGGRVLVSCERDAGRLVFLVEDNGPGLPPQHLRHIFERNWQAPATASAGNGLGLFIAKGIVDAHRGHIWVESEPGLGCRFRFSVPEAPPLERVLDRDAGENVKRAHVDLGGGAGVHVAEPVAIASLQLERETLRKVDVHPQAGHA